ncbi:MAG: glycosyltransferase family 4 protein [Ardenticatenaceae bacterium]|nr:glycosyltransferase family 4 protein [Ardenticatenaceae bacterium]
MRIAILGPYPYPPDRASFLGGVEAVVHSLAGALRRYHQAEVHVITCNQAAKHYDRFERADGVVVHALPRARMGHVLHYIFDIPPLCRLLRSLQPDIAHAHGASIYSGVTQHTPEIPALITLHGLLRREAVFSEGLWSRLQWHRRTQYETKVCTRARNIVVVNPYVTEELGGLLRGRLYNVENPVDESLFTIESLPTSHRVLMPGRIVARKGVLDLVAAWAHVRAAVPDAELRLCGEIESERAYVARVRAQAEALGVADSIVFCGALTPEAMLEEYAAAGVVVLASYQETAPVIISEAFAAGRPVVATRAGGVAFMVDEGVTGHHLPVGAVDVLAARLIALLHNDARRCQMGSAARAQAQERFHVRAVAARTVDIYQQVIADHRRTSRPRAAGSHIVHLGR